MMLFGAVFLILLIQIDAGIRDLMHPKTIRIFKFQGTCKGYENATISLRDIHLLYSNRIHLISLKSVATEQIDEDLRLQLDLKRCKSREALDTCENYQSVKVNHLCQWINAENRPWTPLVKNAEPPMGCPIQKGVRVCTNGTFDGSAFGRLPIAGFYWIVTGWLFGVETDRILMCIKFEGQLVSA